MNTLIDPKQPQHQEEAMEMVQNSKLIHSTRDRIKKRSSPSYYHLLSHNCDDRRYSSQIFSSSSFILLLLVQVISSAAFTPSSLSTTRTQSYLSAIPITTLTTNSIRSSSTRTPSIICTLPQQQEQQEHKQQRQPKLSLSSSSVLFKSFLPCSTTVISSMTTASRYGGRSNSFITTSSDNDINTYKGRVLGFDLTMASSSSSSSSESQQVSMNQSHQHDIHPITMTTTMSPIKKQVIKNILHSNPSNTMKDFDYNQRPAATAATTTTTTTTATSSNPRRSSISTNTMEIEGNHNNPSSKNRGSNVPMWFPFIPTREQIQSLKIVELRDACYERGLIKSGNKHDLQERLINWTNLQHQRRVLERNALRTSSSSIPSTTSTPSTPLQDTINQVLHHDNESFDSFLSSSFDAFSAASALASAISSPTTTSSSSSRSASSSAKNQSNDEQTLLRNEIDNISVDTIEPLINRRKALLRSKQFSFSKNKKGILGFDIIDSDDEEENDEDDYDDADYFPLSTPEGRDDYLTGLTKTFHESKSVHQNEYDVGSDSVEVRDLDVYTMNNYQLRELYLKAKYADQKGDSQLSKALLNKLLQVTPNDTRVMRRLARLEIQGKNYHRGREILQNGLRVLPNDVNLLHGLGQLERKCGNLNKAREYFKEAIQACPTVPNPYHALGTLEHSEGNIRASTTVLRTGLKLCPSNHRLHHALGDLYRDAKMLDMAEKAYLRGLKCLDVDSASKGIQMDWSRSFFYTAMSYLSYDRDDKETSRRWLKKSIALDHNKMHAQGWLGLAQLEESEGHIDTARKIYQQGLDVYEKQRGIKKFKASSRSMLGRGDRVKPPKLGDRWLDVYESLIRLEEKHGDYDSANNVYSQAATAFPRNWNILSSWARFQIRNDNHTRARTLFELACRRAGNSDSDPFRIYAEFEMSLSNYRRARSILFQGAQSSSESSDGSLYNEKLSHLYHTWAVCEWQLGNLDRSEVLFDHSLRLTDAGTRGSDTRSFIFLSIARFLFHARKDFALAQHCVSLALTENTRSKASWMLWSKIANIMGNKTLSFACIQEADKISAKTRVENRDTLESVNNKNMNHMLRQAPWHYKIVDVNEKSWYDAINFPDDDLNFTEETRDSTQLLQETVAIHKK